MDTIATEAELSRLSRIPDLTVHQVCNWLNGGKVDTDDLLGVLEAAIARAVNKDASNEALRLQRVFYEYEKHYAATENLLSGD